MSTSLSAQVLPESMASGTYPLPLPDLHSCTLAVIGLGYVGLPLAVAFARPASCLRTGAELQRTVIGYDINPQRLQELRQGLDRTRETSTEDLRAATLRDASPARRLTTRSGNARPQAWL